jgi:hypothetical protein
MRLAMQADQGYTAFKLNDKNVKSDLTVTQEDLNTWKTETLHGKYSNCLQVNYVDKEYFLSWLSVGIAETEGFCIRLRRLDVQNQKLLRMSVQVVDRCRRCAKQ